MVENKDREYFQKLANQLMFNLTTYIRQDEPDHVISQDDAMRNVTKKLEGHFVLPKVVK